MGDFKTRNTMKQERDYYCHDDRAGERTVKFKGNKRRGRWRGGGRDGGGGFSGADQYLFDHEGDVNMGGDAETSRKARFVPYESGRGHRKYSGKMKRGRGGPDRMDFNSRKQDGWYRVTIPYGKNNSKQFILQSITQLSTVPFVPFYYHHEGQTAIFYVEGKQIANAIQQVSKKITTPDGYKLRIMTDASPPPQPQLDENVVEKIKLCMGKRFMSETNELNLSSLSADPDLRVQGIYAPIDRPSVMAKVVKIIEENLPTLRALNLSGNRLSSLEGVRILANKVKTISVLNVSKNLLRSMNEFDLLKEMPLEELVLQSNPVCDSFNNTASLVSAVRQRFPKLVRLDGNELPPQYGFDVAKTAALPPSQGNFFVNDTVRNIIPQFLEQYFHIYDSGDRQKLLDAYHDQAMFSFSVTLPKSGSINSFNNMLSESRNLLRITQFGRRLKLLHQGKLSVVSFLCELPRTQHDPASFSVDVTQAFSKYMIITCCGVFREVTVDGRPANAPMRAFNRVFVIIQFGEGFCIVNETLNICNATSEQSKVAFKVPAPTPSPSPVPAAVAVLSSPSVELQEQMVMNFASQSRMTIPWARQCLEQNDWDYDKAAHVFQELFKANQIPTEAFEPM